MATDVTPKSSTELSVGAGLAIAGIWLATSAVSIIIMMILFVWSAPGEASDPNAIWIVILLVAAPILTAYSITKKILDKDT